MFLVILKFVLNLLTKFENTYIKFKYVYTKCLTKVIHEAKLN